MTTSILVLELKGPLKAEGPKAFENLAGIIAIPALCLKRSGKGTWAIAMLALATNKVKSVVFFNISEQGFVVKLSV